MAGEPRGVGAATGGPRRVRQGLERAQGHARVRLGPSIYTGVGLGRGLLALEADEITHSPTHPHESAKVSLE